MRVQVPREEAIFQRIRPAEAVVEGFALANTGEVHRVPSLVVPCSILVWGVMWGWPEEKRNVSIIPTKRHAIELFFARGLFSVEPRTGTRLGRL